MIPPRRILFPVDFSERCTGAAHVVRAAAKRFHSEVLALHVATTGEDLAVEALQKLIDTHLPVPHVMGQVVTGEPADRIVEAAETGAFDLIIMPTHGAGPFRRYLVGSVAAKVLHDAPCPVWTSIYLEKWPSFEQARMDRIICGVDFGARSSQILRCAAQIAREFHAQLTLVHTMPQLNSKALTRDYCTHALEAIQQQLRSVDGGFTSPPPVELLEGSPATCLSEAADRLNADLIVIGRTHERGHKIGSNAYAIITHAPCPVLSI